MGSIRIPLRLWFSVLLISTKNKSPTRTNPNLYYKFFMMRVNGKNSVVQLLSRQFISLSNKKYHFSPDFGTIMSRENGLFAPEWIPPWKKTLTR